MQKHIHQGLPSLCITDKPARTPVKIVAPAAILSFLTISLLKNLSLSEVNIGEDECVDIGPTDAVK